MIEVTPDNLKKALLCKHLYQFRLQFCFTLVAVRTSAFWYIFCKEGAKYNNRYDVTILVNGLPLIHVELKRRGVQLKEAFNQINRYQNDSFWVGCGLYEYIQIFIISNGTHTKYYSNTTRNSHIKEQEFCSCNLIRSHHK